MSIQLPPRPHADQPDVLHTLEAELARGIEVCPLCDLSDVVSCPACDGRDWIVLDTSHTR